MEFREDSSLFTRCVVVVIRSLGILLGTGFPLLVAHAVEFNLSSDYSGTNNPNGVWSYGSKATISNGFSVYSSHQFTPVSGGRYETWYSSSHVSAVTRNNSTQTIVTDGGEVVVAPGRVWINAGADDFGTVRFTSPNEGSYSIQSSAESLFVGTGSGDTEYRVVKNGVEVFGEFIPASNAGVTNRATFNGTLSLAAGETVDFLAGRGLDNNYNRSGIKIDLVISLINSNPPVITQEPQDLTVTAGGLASFSVTADGNSLTYQWFHEGAGLANATNRTLIVDPVQTSQSGDYFVVVANPYGNATSRIASLTVNASDLEFNLSRDYSGTNNPNGVWSYGSKGTIGGAFSAYDSIHFTPVYEGPGVPTIVGYYETWYTVSHVSAVTRNNSTKTNVTDGGQVVVAPGRVWINAGADDFGAVRFTAPAGGSYAIQSSVESLFVGSSSGDTEYRVVKNGVEVFGEFIPASNGVTNTVSFNDTVSLSAGESVDFLAGRGLDNDWNRSGIKIDLTISLVNSNPGPPIIRQQPQDQTVYVDQNVTFSVQAIGDTPFSYQWFYETSPLANATNQNLVLGQVQTNQAGHYFVVVTNPHGSETSRVAVLTVNTVDCVPTPPEMIAWWQAESNTLDSITGNSALVVGDLAYATGKVGQAFVFNGTNAHLKIPAHQLDPGAEGSGLSVEGWVSPFRLSNQPIWEWNNGLGSPGSALGEGAQLWVSVFGAPGTGPGSLWGNIVDTAGHPHTMNSAAGSLTTNGFQHVALTYDKASGVGALYVNGVKILQQALGTFTPQTSYDFYLGYRPTSEQKRFAGQMDEVAVYNRALTSNEIAAIHALGKCPLVPTAPSIVQQPASQMVPEGSVAAFSVTAAGSKPLSYQWRFGGTPLNGATNSSLILSNLVLTQEGSYDVVVANQYGSVTSNPAMLMISRARVLAVGYVPAQQEGTTLTVPITLISTGDVGGMVFKVLYDTNYLKNPQLDWSSISGAFTDANTSKAGEVRATLALPATTIDTGTQTVAQLSFFLRSVSNSLSSPLTLEVLDMSGPNGETLTGTLARSSQVDIQVRTIIGDNNANQRLDVGDATAVLRYLAALEEVRPWDVRLNDLNLNTNLDSGDAIKILRVASGMDPQPGGGMSSPAFNEAATGPVNAIVSPALVKSVPGSNVTFQVMLQNLSTPLSGASFTLNYNTNALRLVGSSSYRAGSIVPGSGALALWNIAPETGNLNVQNGRASFAASSANPWSNNNGVLAELTFQIQPTATNQYLWPVTLTSVETTENGYRNHQLLSSGAALNARGPSPARLTASRPAAGGQFSLTLTGDAGATYTVQVSSDLHPDHWTTLATVNNANGTTVVTDPDSADYQMRFYRVLGQP